MDIRRVGGWASVLGLTAVLAISTFRCGPGAADAEWRAVRARGAKLEAKRAAAKAVVNAAYERSGGDWDAVREAVRRADWLSGEEWADLNAIREQIEKLESRLQPQGGPVPSDTDGAAANATPSGSGVSSGE